MTLDEFEAAAYGKGAELSAWAYGAMQVVFREAGRVGHSANEAFLAFAAAHGLDASRITDIAFTLAAFVGAGVLALLLLERFEYHWPFAQGWARVLGLLFWSLAGLAAAYTHREIVGASGAPALETMFLLVCAALALAASYLVLNLFQVVLGHGTYIGRFIAFICFVSFVAAGAAFQVGAIARVS